MVEKSQLELLELKVPLHFFQLEGPRWSFGEGWGRDISTWVSYSEWRRQLEDEDRNTDGNSS